ncbi:MAG: hypothetical protein JXJ04_26235 [Spirochaetales bacterium]|nr:hypothetical protein [Spirochaetales bacterium]
MKLNKKSIPLFIAFLFMGCLIGSIFWEVLERILHLFPGLASFSLTTERPLLFFDLYILSFGLRANPGTLLGLAGGTIFFFRI